MATTLNPTKQTYNDLDKAYEFFNKKLFHGKLPRCLVTLQRKSRALGFFHRERFASRNGDSITDEIALNPQHFKQQTTQYIASVLVHEMAHQFQFHFGTPTRGGYHNKEWGLVMKEIGLYPSNTAQPGGKETGQQMAHYIIPGGLFEIACAELLKSKFDVKYMDRVQDEQGKVVEKKKRESKTKYTCPECGLNAWAKPEVLIACVQCATVMKK